MCYHDGLHARHSGMIHLWQLLQAVGTEVVGTESEA